MLVGHEPETVIFDGEGWKIICVCGWECAYADEEEAWETYNEHVYDDVNTLLRRLRTAAKVTRL